MRFRRKTGLCIYEKYVNTKIKFCHNILSDVDMFILQKYGYGGWVSMNHCCGADGNAHMLKDGKFFRFHFFFKSTPSPFKSFPCHFHIFLGQMFHIFSTIPENFTVFLQNLISFPNIRNFILKENLENDKAFKKKNIYAVISTFFSESS